MGLRRSFIALLVAATCVAAPAAHGDPVNVDEWNTAFAEFEGTHIDRNHWKWYGAFVTEWAPVDGGEPSRHGGVFKGTCERTKTPNFTSISCHGTGLGLSKRDRFSMDTLAQEATLDVSNENGHHHVEWTATEDNPGLFISESSCDAGSGLGAGITRRAAAEGHLYGHHFKSKTSNWNFNHLWSGPHASQCDLLSERDLRDLRDGGGFTIHRRYKVAK
jgi:hypothetical protein